MTEREDRQDIADVLLRYATGIDRRDWPLFRTVFTDDCELDYGEVGSWKGVDAVTEFMQQAHAMAGHTMHRLTNQVITVDGDTAQARTYVDALIMLADNSSGVNAAGFYDDDFVRTERGWQIARRRFHPGAGGSGGGDRHDICSQVRPVGVGGRRIRRRWRRLRRGACRARGQRRVAGAATGRAGRGGCRDRRPHRRRNPRAGSRSR